MATYLLWRSSTRPTRYATLDTAKDVAERIFQGTGVVVGITEAMTQEDAAAVNGRGGCAVIYPRRREVVCNGFQRFPFVGTFDRDWGKVPMPRQTT